MENINKLLRDYPLLRRMVLYILLFSLTTTILFTSVNMYAEYLRAIRSIHNRLDSMEKNQMEVLANSVWTFNMAAIKIQLSSIFQNEDIVFLELSDDSGVLYETGSKPYDAKDFITRKVELYHDDYGEIRHLGTFRVYATTANVRKYLIGQLPLLIASQFIFLISICAFVLILFYYLFSRHLLRIVRFTKDLDIDRLDRHLDLGRGTSGRGQPDELERIVSAINEMQKRLRDDIIRMDKVEQSLRESETKYREIYNSPNEVIFIHDAASGDLYDINEAVNEVYGYTREEALQAGPEAMSAGYEPFTRDDVYRKVQAAVHEGPQVFEWLAKKKSGARFWVEVSLKFVEIGVNRYVIAVVRDIDARKQAEHKFAEEKERLSVTLRSIGDGVITTDVAGNVVLVNSVAEQLTGWSQEEAAGRTLKEVFSIINEKTGEPCANPVESVIASGEICGLENDTVLISRDGTKRSIADSGASIRDDEGRIIGIVLVFRDVTEKVRMEKELLKVKKLESVGLLAGGIAHDFNNILLAILGNINLVRSSLNPDSKPYHLLEAAEKASLRARDLTYQLLTFAKGGEPVKKVSSITEIIRDSAEFVLRGSNVRCQYYFAEDVWPVKIDAGQISQVIQNLIINADEAMQSGGKLRIHCRNFKGDQTRIPLEQSDYVEIIIEDEGTGIPADILEKIFDPYFTTKKDGSGLGLAITHSIVSKHGGHVFVESGMGSGTSFSIYLPATREAVPVREESDRYMIPADGRRILIMDDELMIRDVVKTILVEAGYDVLLASDGAEAIETYRKSMDSECPIDLVITDLTVPGGMGGEEAVPEILQINPSAKVVVSSGYSNDPVMAHFRQYGFCDTITKPYKPEDLIDVLNRNL